jgi:hypothetical protein
MMAVTGLNKPDFRTISTFRRRHLVALRGLFVQVLRLCQTAGLVKLGHVAVARWLTRPTPILAASYARFLAIRALPPKPIWPPWQSAASGPISRRAASGMARPIPQPGVCSNESP